MTGFPDDNPPTLMPFPASPAAYVAQSGQISGTGTVTTDLKDFSDGKLYLLHALTFNGYVYNTDTTGPNICSVRLQLLKGLDAASAALTLCGMSSSLGQAATATSYFSYLCKFEAPAPLVFQAAGSAGVQKLQLVRSTSTASVLGYYTLVCWPLN